MFCYVELLIYTFICIFIKFFMHTFLCIHVNHRAKYIVDVHVCLYLCITVYLSQQKTIQ